MLLQRYEKVTQECIVVDSLHDLQSAQGVVDGIVSPQVQSAFPPP